MDAFVGSGCGSEGSGGRPFGGLPGVSPDGFLLFRGIPFDEDGNAMEAAARVLEEKGVAARFIVDGFVGGPCCTEGRQNYLVVSREGEVAFDALAVVESVGLLPRDNLLISVVPSLADALIAIQADDACGEHFTGVFDYRRGVWAYRPHAGACVEFCRGGFVVDVDDASTVFDAQGRMLCREPGMVLGVYEEPKGFGWCDIADAAYLRYGTSTLLEDAGTGTVYRIDFTASKPRLLRVG